MVEEILNDLRAKYPGISDFSLGKMYLYERMESGEASSLELVLLSLLYGQITLKQFLDYVQIETGCQGC